ncbi:MAG: hypothetical protein DRI61_03455 [Chloroflexi bacterium]|nr:MAG: hypothetical protein DRI61_03455 [Chloroflexota bacterium]
MGRKNTKYSQKGVVKSPKVEFKPLKFHAKTFKEGTYTREFTDHERKLVILANIAGVKKHLIAKALKCSVKTYEEELADEIEVAGVEQDINVVNGLYKNAVHHNNVVAQIYWTKARMGWAETTEVRHSGSIDLVPKITIEGFGTPKSALPPPDTESDIIDVAASEDEEYEEIDYDNE